MELKKDPALGEEGTWVGLLEAESSEMGEVARAGEFELELKEE